MIIKSLSMICCFFVVFFKKCYDLVAKAGE